jgi:antitoxin (DNA-binding transcriptional repressor) of toxin-antitoxin stability system
MASCSIQSDLSDTIRRMVRLSATEVARSFSSIVSRVGAGEEIEVVRNGVPVIEMRPATGGNTVPAERWRDVFAGAPSVDAEFARDAETARGALGPPDGAWPS